MFYFLFYLFFYIQRFFKKCASSRQRVLHSTFTLESLDHQMESRLSWLLQLFQLHLRVPHLKFLE
eukprot:UN05347